MIVIQNYNEFEPFFAIVSQVAFSNGNNGSCPLFRAVENISFEKMVSNFLRKFSNVNVNSRKVPRTSF